MVVAVRLLEEFLALCSSKEAAFQAVVALERECYPADEAASPEKMAFRRRYAPEFFLVAVENDARVVGLAMATRASELSHASMSSHVDDGTALCLHSVATRSDRRRRGIGRMLVQHLLRIARETNGIERVVLITKAVNVSLYRSCGFRYTRDSLVTHGADYWFEMEFPVSREAAALRVACVDAFALPGAAGKCTGNPAAVVVYPASLKFSSDDDDYNNKRARFSHSAATASNALTAWMGNVAAEMNLAESAFVRMYGEVPLGATLAPLDRLLALVEAGDCPALLFADVTALIKSCFRLASPTVEMRVGSVKSAPGQNAGTFAVMALAEAVGLSRHPAARLWAEHYRSVKEEQYPCDSHPNIREFLKFGEGDRAIFSPPHPIAEVLPAGAFTVLRRNPAYLVRSATGHREALLRMLVDIGAFLTPEEATSFCDALVEGRTTWHAYLCKTFLRDRENDYRLRTTSPDFLSECLRAWARERHTHSHHALDRVNDEGKVEEQAREKRARNRKQWLIGSLDRLASTLTCVDDDDVTFSSTMPVTSDVLHLLEFSRVNALDYDSFMAGVTALQGTRPLPPRLSFSRKGWALRCQEDRFLPSLATMRASLRWFTPARAEVAMCGHATLAATHALLALEGILPGSQAQSGVRRLEFSTLSGILKTQVTPRGEIEMDFPETLRVPSPFENLASPELARALSLLGGIDSSLVESAEMTAIKDVIICLALPAPASEALIVSLKPNLEGLRSAFPDVRGFCVTARWSSPYDYGSRFFAPSVGIPEDPATGSVHTALARVWGTKLNGKTRTKAFQAFPGRGAAFEVNWRKETGRVGLIGLAVATWEGKLLGLDPI